MHSNCDITVIKSNSINHRHQSIGLDQHFGDVYRVATPDVTSLVIGAQFYWDPATARLLNILAFCVGTQVFFRETRIRPAGQDRRYFLHLKNRKAECQ